MPRLPQGDGERATQSSGRLEEAVDAADGGATSSPGSPSPFAGSVAQTMTEDSQGHTPMAVSVVGTAGNMVRKVLLRGLRLKVGVVPLSFFFFLSLSLHAVERWLSICCSCVHPPRE